MRMRLYTAAFLVALAAGPVLAQTTTDGPLATAADDRDDSHGNWGLLGLLGLAGLIPLFRRNDRTTATAARH